VLSIILGQWKYVCCGMWRHSTRPFVCFVLASNSKTKP